MQSSQKAETYLPQSDLSSKTEQWRRCLILLALLWVVALFAYRETAWSMVSIWIESETYSHGMLILPISLWLIWGLRHELFSLSPSLDLWPAVGVVLASLSWLMGDLVHVTAVQQFSLVFLLISLTWLCIGNQAARLISFPLAYLLFAVPVGEVFVPPMMELTATQTVELVRMTGIPVFREGLYFSLPSGNWSVVRACSGVRYLIASLALGTIYAYLNYHSLWRRLLFVGAAIVVPIVANVLRAFMIVMIGHHSDMKLATGVDHLIYGWVFFGAVMLLLFWVGSRFSDADSAGVNIGEDKAVNGDTRAAARAGLTGLTLAGFAICVMFAVPWHAYQLQNRPVPKPAAELVVLGLGDQWTAIDSVPWSWRPPFEGASAQTHSFFEAEGRRYGVSLGLYIDQREGSEMISYRNGLTPRGDEKWKAVSLRALPRQRAPDLPAASLSKLEGEGASLTIASWYKVGGLETSNQYLVKVKELLQKLAPGEPVSLRVLVYADSIAGTAEVDDQLEDFIRVLRPAIDGAVHRVVESVSR